MPSIRRAKPTDLPQFEALGVEAYGKAFYEYDGPYTEEDLTNFPQGTVVYGEEEVRGYAFFYPIQGSPTLHLPWYPPRNIDYPDQLYLYDLVVASKHRHHGIGCLLMGEVFRAATEQHLDHISLIAVLGSHTYWARYGFTQNQRLEYLPGITAIEMSLRKQTLL